MNLDKFDKRCKDIGKDKITMFKGINWSLPGDIHNQRIGQETAILQVIGQETELVTRNYERYHQELLSLDHFLHPKKLRYHLILSRVIDDQPVKESDWTKGTTGHIQPKLVASDPTFPRSLSPCKKSKL